MVKCQFCHKDFLEEDYPTHVCSALGNVSRGVKHNQGKPRISLIPPAGLLEVAGVYTYGEKKYVAHNWRKGIPYSELLDATMRHILAFVNGEDNDKESGRPHLAHACFGLLDILQFQHDGRDDLDDRYKEEKE